MGLKTRFVLTSCLHQSRPVRPGGRFAYEFNVHQEGTYFYRSE
ncbi:MAG: multicopper oxidase domain-containing protein [Acidobacteriota bacterium]|nr:multicopper oxidase domain-containing protein [Acidobacteriota bacterium]